MKSQISSFLPTYRSIETALIKTHLHASNDPKNAK
jgi:hypothetical protein